MQLWSAQFSAVRDPEPRVRNAETSALPALDQPLSAAETQLLADLAPLAGSSARALKRFVNLYRLVRAAGPKIIKARSP
ncbi:hypothetical protein ACVBEG_27495 [Pseudomonas sp. GG8]